MFSIIRAFQQSVTCLLILLLSRDTLNYMISKKSFQREGVFAKCGNIWATALALSPDMTKVVCIQDLDWCGLLSGDICSFAGGSVGKIDESGRQTTAVPGTTVGLDTGGHGATSIIVATGVVLLPQEIDFHVSTWNFCFSWNPCFREWTPFSFMFLTMEFMFYTIGINFLSVISMFQAVSQGTDPIYHGGISIFFHDCLCVTR